MNKKQLRESIMSGVEKAFKTDKALNEGFSAWKEANVPKFNLTAFYESTRSFLTVVLNLLKCHQMSAVKFSIYNPDNNSYSTILEADDQTGPESAIMNIQGHIKGLKERLGEDGFVAAMGKTAFILAVPVKSHLWNYMESTIDVASNRINGLDCIRFKRPTTDTTEVRLYISTKELIENVDLLVDYFS